MIYFGNAFISVHLFKLEKEDFPSSSVLFTCSSKDLSHLPGKFSEFANYLVVNVIVPSAATTAL